LPFFSTLFSHIHSFTSSPYRLVLVKPVFSLFLSPTRPPPLSDFFCRPRLEEELLLLSIWSALLLLIGFSSPLSTPVPCSHPPFTRIWCCESFVVLRGTPVGPSFALYGLPRLLRALKSVPILSRVTPFCAFVVYFSESVLVPCFLFCLWGSASAGNRPGLGFDLSFHVALASNGLLSIHRVLFGV